MAVFPQEFAISVFPLRERETNFYGKLVTAFILGLLPMFVILIWLAQCMFTYKQIQGTATFWSNWFDDHNVLCFYMEKHI